MTNTQRAADFTRLHIKGTPIVLYNIWDAGSARAVVKAGALAVATGSASVSSAQGYDDGENLPLDDLERTVRQVVGAVDVPVSVDMESGYGATPEAVGRTAVRLARTGAVGCNFEDQKIGENAMFDIATMSARLQGVREGLAQAGLTMHINARTDLFLLARRDAHPSLLSEAVSRGRAYAAAGADSFFVPGLVDGPSIAALCEQVELPLNVMMAKGALPLAELARMGVARVSYGPGPYRESMRALTETAKSVYR